MYLGIGFGILNFTTGLLKSRKSSGFDQPLAYHPTNRAHVGRMAADLQSARLSMLYAAWYSDTYGPSMETFHQFLRAKAVVAKTIQTVIQSASVACGLHGAMKSYPLERMIQMIHLLLIMPPNIDAVVDNVGLFTMDLNPAEVMPPLKPSEQNVLVKG